MTEEQRVKEEKKILPIAIVYLLILLVMVGLTYLRGNYVPYTPSRRPGTYVAAEVVSVEPDSYVVTHHYVKSTKKEISFPDELNKGHLLCICRTAQGDEFSLYILAEAYAEVFGDWGTFEPFNIDTFLSSGGSLPIGDGTFKSAGPIELDTPLWIKGKLEYHEISKENILAVTFQGLADEP